MLFRSAETLEGVSIRLAAGNAGEWPHNGASRVLCLPSCAEACVGPWATVVPPEAAQ